MYLIAYYNRNDIKHNDNDDHDNNNDNDTDDDYNNNGDFFPDHD